MTESEHSEEVERVVETHSQQQQLSGLGERPSEARCQETDAEIRELMSLSGIGWPETSDEEPETSAADVPADAKQQQQDVGVQSGTSMRRWKH